MILTEKVARALKATDKAVFDGKVTGLLLTPSNSGCKWTLRYMSPITGKRRDMGLGTYPAITIASARETALEQRKLIALGKDPIDHRDRAKASVASPAVLTFGKAAALVHNDLKPGWKNTKHAAQWINTLATYAFPVIGEKALPAITPGDCADVLRPIWLVKPETASRTKQRMHAVFSWAWAHGHIAANPVAVVDHLLPKQDSTGKEHHPAMPWRDCAAFISEHLQTRSPSDSVKGGLEFLILTGVRSDAVRGMTWDEIDFDAKVWSPSIERIKEGKRHRVPLSDRAVEILELQRASHLHKRLVFPSPRGLVLSDMAFTALLRRVKAKSDVPSRYATAHGFRSSFRDWASENSYASDLAERALGHAIANKVEAAYHRTDLLEQRRSMMEAWSVLCGSPAPSGN